MKTNRKTKLMKAVGVLLVLALTISSVGVYGKVAEAKTKTSAKLKKACKAAVKKTGNAKRLDPEMSTSKPSRCNVLSSYYEKKVSSMYYMTNGDAFEVCVAKAKTTNYAKKICKNFAKHKKMKYSIRYDYPLEEVKVIKNTVYGRKGKYVWYISMSTSKKKNKAGEAAIKKSLKI